MWDIQAGQEVQSFRGHKEWVSNVAYSPDGRYLVSASVDGTVKLWELVGKDGSSGYGHVREVRAVAVSPNGEYLATGSADRTIRLWDLKTARERVVLSGHTDTVTAVGFTADSKQLISAADDRSLRLWDVATGKEVAVLLDALSNEVPTLTPLKDGKVRVWVANRLIETYDLNQGKQVKSLSGHDQDIASLAFSSDGELAALGGVDGTVRIWNILKEERVLKDKDKKDIDLKAHDEGISDLAFTPDKKLLITADKNGEIKVWDLEKQQAVKTIPALKQPVVATAMSPDGKRFAMATMDNVVRVFGIADGKMQREWRMRAPLQANRPFIRNLTFTPDGKQVATANANTTAYLLDCP